MLLIKVKWITWSIVRPRYEVRTYGQRAFTCMLDLTSRRCTVAGLEVLIEDISVWADGGTSSELENQHQHCPPRLTGVGSRRASRRTSPTGQHSLRHPRSARSLSSANARRAAPRSASARRQSWNAHNYVHVTGSAVRTELGTPKQSYQELNWSAYCIQ